MTRELAEKRGYGWVRPKGIRKELKKMTEHWKGSNIPLKMKKKDRPALSHEQGKSYMEKGDELLKSADHHLAVDFYDKAIQVFTRLIDKNPCKDLKMSLATAYINKSTSLKNLGKDQSAKEIHNKGLNILEGEVYKGKRLSFPKTGRIKEFHKNGNILYEGESKNGKRHGKGKLYNINGVLEYVGDFENSYYHGKGILYYDNSNVCYEGDFKEGKPNGYGKIYKENGALKYDGLVKNSKMNGTGTGFLDDGTIVYKGEWKDNQKHGKGKGYYNSGKIMYVGEWKYGEFHGKGTLYTENGKFFKGKFREGKPEV